MSPRVRPRAVVGRVLLVGVLWLFGGGIGLVAGAAFVVYDLVSRPTPRDLLVLAVLAARPGPAGRAGPWPPGCGGGRAPVRRGQPGRPLPGRCRPCPAGRRGPPRGPGRGAAVTALVSVVVPTRNAGRTIETCLRSIRAQTWPSLELIVVDNGSVDGTWAVAERHADLILRGGPERSAQRNLGIAHAAGEWVCYVDADMELGPDVIERAVLAGEADDAVGVAIPEESVGPGFWTRCRTLERRCLRDEPGLLWPRLIRTWYLRHTGGFALWLTGTEDAELHRRMVADEVPICLADGLILHHEGRLHPARPGPQAPLLRPGPARLPARPPRCPVCPGQSGHPRHLAAPPPAPGQTGGGRRDRGHAHRRAGRLRGRRPGRTPRRRPLSRPPRAARPGRPAAPPRPLRTGPSPAPTP